MKELLYEGKAKKVYTTADQDLLLVEYKDDATADNGKKKGTINGKGAINNQMSNILMRYLQKNDVPTHYVAEVSDTETIVKRVQIIPLEVIVRNIAAGSFCRRYGVDEGIEFKQPTFEVSYKNDELGDPLMAEDHVTALGIVNFGDFKLIHALAMQINKLLKSYFKVRDTILVDFKLEFGRLPDGSIILADEISPDTCRFWDARTKQKLDKDRFRNNLGGVEDAYTEIFNRVTDTQYTD